MYPSVFGPDGAPLLCEPGGAPLKEFHPAANLFPLMTGKPFEELVADIRKNGLRKPILLDKQGRILDGRNRYRACLAAGVEPRFETWEDEGDLTELALSLNLKRRHLNESQRAMVAARLAKMLTSQRRASLSKFAQGQLSKIRDAAAAQINVSTRLVIHAIKVVDHGCPELVATVESGEVAVSTASALAALPADEQAKVAAGGAAEVVRKVRELRSRGAPAPAGSPRHFSLIRVDTHGQDPLVVLWVPLPYLAAAIEALQARGFGRKPAEA